jgi:hypothetical protein
MIEPALKDPRHLTGAELLALGEPERLFSPTAAAIKQAYRALAWAWHPDRNTAPEAAAVFAHVGALYHAALAKLARGRWHVPGLFRCTARDGAVHIIRYQRQVEFELGTMLIAKTALVFVLRPEFADLFDAGQRALARPRFANDAMRAQIAPCLPLATTTIATPDGPVLIVDKAPELVRLRDLLDHVGGALDPRHVAWIVSSLLNLACWLDYAGLTHNAIGLEAVFVAPHAHRCALLGGWWYAAARGARLQALPARSAALAPPDVLAARTADIRVDLELIRATGRALLGDETGSALARGVANGAGRAPRPLVDWLRGAPCDTALGDYELWGSVLEASFGARRFVELGVSASDIYR